MRSEIKQLLIIYCQLYRPALADTISRWSKNFLELSGIDTSKYKCHRNRVASISHVARQNNAYLNDIMQAAEWSHF